MREVVVQYGDVEFKMDAEDYFQLPEFFVVKFDKDGYPLIYFYSEVTRREESFRLHRWVLHNPVGMFVDHINGDKKDARKSNLRAVTAQQNSWNRKPLSAATGKTRSSKYKGVTLKKDPRFHRRPWIASIQIPGTRKTKSKNCATEVEAAQAYNELALKYHGEYAYLNKIEE